MNVRHIYPGGGGFTEQKFREYGQNFRADEVESFVNSTSKFAQFFNETERISFLSFSRISLKTLVTSPGA